MFVFIPRDETSSLCVGGVRKAARHPTHLVGDVELLHQVALEEHPDGGLAGVLVGQLEVDEGEAVEVVVLGGGDLLFYQLVGGVVARRRVIRQTF